MKNCAVWAPESNGWMTEQAFWEQYLRNAKRRLGTTGSDAGGERSVFQRDFDRIVFSDAFRRLQNKTQVVPLPDNESVRNRLTHSLETSSVARSLGILAGRFFTEKYPDLAQFLRLRPEDFGAMVSAAALAHDIGNPPFGHQGEAAISEYFRTGDYPFREELTEAQRKDLEHFEGNAAGFRILAHTQMPGSSITGGLRLSLGTYGSFVKYPGPSHPKPDKPAGRSRKKYGYFQADAKVFHAIAGDLNLLPHKGSDASFKRFPLVFLTEAADDICYSVIDYEDGYHLGRIGFDEIFEHLNALVHTYELPANFEERLKQIRDKSQQIGYLRSLAINALVHHAAEAFIRNEQGILDGSFDRALADDFPGNVKEILRRISQNSVERIYRHPEVLHKEAAGKSILPDLVDRFVKAQFEPERYRQFYLLMPTAYRGGTTAYEKILNAVMFVASMSDRQAVQWYRNFNGLGKML